MNAQNKSKTSLSLEERIAESAAKHIEKRTKDAVDSGLSQGISPSQVFNTILGSIGANKKPQALQPNEDVVGMLSQMLQQRTAPSSTSDKLQAGLTILSGGMIPTPGYNRIARKKQNPVGINELISLINLKNQEEKQPLEMQNLQSQIQKNQLDIATSDPSYQADSEALKESRKGLNEFTVMASKGVNSLDKIENAAIQLGDFETGFFNQIGERSASALELFKKTPQYVRFNAVTNQEFSNIARNLGGEKGALAKDDIKRVQDGLGDVTLPLAQKLELLDELKSGIAVELSTRLETSFIDKESYNKRFPQIEKSLSKSKKRTSERNSKRLLTPLQAKEMGADEYDDKTGEFFSGGELIGRMK